MKNFSWRNQELFTSWHDYIFSKMLGNLNKNTYHLDMKFCSIFQKKQFAKNVILFKKLLFCVFSLNWFSISMKNSFLVKFLFLWIFFWKIKKIVGWNFFQKFSNHSKKIYLCQVTEVSDRFEKIFPTAKPIKGFQNVTAINWNFFCKISVFPFSHYSRYFTNHSIFTINLFTGNTSPYMLNVYATPIFLAFLNKKLKIFENDLSFFSEKNFRSVYLCLYID